MTELENFLDANIGYVQKAVLDVPSGQDLRPFLSYIKEDGDLVFVDVAGGFADSDSKDLMMAWCRGRLRTDRAQKYALISAAWVVGRTDPAQAAELQRVVAREGTGGRYRDERREVYLISVGDQQRTLVAILDVERDYKGKIRRLTRNDALSGVELRGRMANLLID
jgi:hypothetical protein